MNQLIYKTLVFVKMFLIRYLYYRPLMGQTRHCRETQDRVLREILDGARDTQFGIDHGFESVGGYESFCAKVPICDYEYLRPYIDRQIHNGTPSLNTDAPRFHAMTSGTTGRAKLIPVLESTVQRYRSSQHIAACEVYRRIPGAYAGKILAFASPAVEGEVTPGNPVGAMSGLIYQSMPRLLKSRYVVPESVIKIRDYEKKFYEIARLGMLEKDVTLVAAANPSTLVKLGQVIDTHILNLLRDVGKTNPDRARELSNIVQSRGRLEFSDLWPGVRAVVTWKGGNCALLLPEMAARFPIETRMIELGYLSSEFRGGITVDAERDIQLPTFTENFYEFVEKAAWEQGSRQFLRLHEVIAGCEYYIFATTRGGLYRYHINDIVRITGWINGTPTLEFVQKGKGVTSITGEKLCEGQVIDSVMHMPAEDRGHLGFLKVLACPEQSRYLVMVDSPKFNLARFEQELCRTNMEYRAKRQSRRLRRPRLMRLETRVADAYKKYCLNDGQREGQFKDMCLQYLEDCKFDFTPYRRQVHEN